MAMPDRSTRAGADPSRRHPYTHPAPSPGGGGKGGGVGGGSTAADRGREDGTTSGRQHSRRDEELPLTARDGAGHRPQHSPHGDGAAGVSAMPQAADPRSMSPQAQHAAGGGAGTDAQLPLNHIEVLPGTHARALSQDVVACVRGHQVVPILLAAGAMAISQAVKAIAVASDQLANAGSLGLDLTFQPAFRTPDRKAPLVACFVQARALSPMPQDVTDLTVGARSLPSKVAGAISGRVRGGQAVRISMIGAEAVAIAVMSVATARLFLQDDKVDVHVRAAIDHFEKDRGAISGMRFTVIADDE